MHENESSHLLTSLGLKRFWFVLHICLHMFSTYVIMYLYGFQGNHGNQKFIYTDQTIEITKNERIAAWYIQTVGCCSSMKRNGVFNTCYNVDELRRCSTKWNQTQIFAFLLNEIIWDRQAQRNRKSLDCGERTACLPNIPNIWSPVMCFCFVFKNCYRPWMVVHAFNPVLWREALQANLVCILNYVLYWEKEVKELLLVLCKKLVDRWTKWLSG